MTPELSVSVRRRIECSRLIRGVAVCVLLVSCAAPAAAQMVMESTEQLSFDRPESWALKYFTSATLLQGLETPRSRKPGSVSIGVEAAWLPSLSEAKQRVGYNGSEAQDLNKAPFFPRPRVTIGLPANLSLVVALVPPVRMFGLKSSLLALAIERPVYETSKLTIGARVYGQIGSTKGSYTCPASAAAAPPFSVGNPEACIAPSADTATLRYAGGEASVALWPDTVQKLSPHVGVGIAYMDVGFKVNALMVDMVDHTRYLSHGMVLSVNGGVDYRLTERWAVAVDLFYSPLSVRRSFGAPSQNDGLFNVRTLLTYRVR